ncbi:MAG: RbsD/FucU family protein [Oscillospiraceae bacterium]
MLKGIPTVISPSLLKVLAEMGHGDTIVVGDAYFAAAAMAKEGALVRADGISAAHLVDAILQLMPLDSWGASCVTAMAADQGNGLEPLEMCKTMLAIIKEYDPNAADTCKLVDRFAFYTLARKAYAAIATGEAGHYGCIILQKGT